MWAQHVENEARKLAKISNLPKGWTTEVWVRAAIFGVNGESFSEREFYNHYQNEFKLLYPNNHNISEKISEQFTVFLKKKYRLIDGDNGIYRIQ